MNLNSNTTPSTIPTSAPISAPPRSRFNPLSWSLGKKVTAGVLVTALAVGGWAAFRPEKLFVNETVSEGLPTAMAGASGAPVLLSQGGFKGLGHHAEGKASIYSQGSQSILRLSDGFVTSNGPDVHVYLVEGANGADNSAI